MQIATVLLVIAVVAGIWGVVAGIRIFDVLRQRGEPGLNFLLVGLMLPIWVHRYARMTRAETGSTGPLFYHYVVAFNLALVAVILSLILRA